MEKKAKFEGSSESSMSELMQRMQGLENRRKDIEREKRIASEKELEYE
jgi:hypothetical protein